jgi:phosphoribosylformylglycinamidine synthase subunit PurL
VVGIVGLLKTAVPLTMDFKRPGRAVVLLGGVGQCDNRQFGSSQYAKVVLKQVWGVPPALDMDYEKRLQAAMREIAEEGLAESAHDLSDGGLAVTAAESSFGPAGVGAKLELGDEMPKEFLLFHEGPSRILLSTDRPEEVGRIARKYSVEAPVLGVTVEGRLEIGSPKGNLVDSTVEGLRGLWQGALEQALKG